MNMSIDYRQHAVVSNQIIFRELQGEGVLLNLDTEQYFGLDDIGTRIWSLLASQKDIQEVFDVLATEYDVTPEQLHQDLDGLIQDLIAHGLIQLMDKS